MALRRNADTPVAGGIWAKGYRELTQSVWSTRLSTMSAPRAGAVRVLRVVHMVAREIAAGQLTLRAMSLVYTTLLSLVPLLAVSFSVLKGFGVQDQLQPMLVKVLAPLGEAGVEITMRIVEFVENVRVGLLGSVGLGLLLYTVISLVQKVERSFNYTWRVRQGRSFGQRFSHYLSVLLVGPVLVFSAVGLTASLASSSITKQLLAVEPLGWLVSNAGTFVPTALITLAFSFAYVFLPNTAVKWRCAFVGALVAGALWHLVGWGFATFVVSTTGTTQAIYSSFAILVLFMVWLYVAWLILLIGSSVAFYTQHPEYLGLLVNELNVSNRMKERLSVQSIFVIAQRYYYGRSAVSSVVLAERLSVPLDPVKDVLEELTKAGILVAAGEPADAYLPARDLSRITVDEVIEVVRAANESTYLSKDRLRTNVAIDDLFERMRSAREQALGGLTLRELVAANPPLGLPEISPVASLATNPVAGEEDVVDDDQDGCSKNGTDESIDDGVSTPHHTKDKSQ
jgi:membrane protein